VSDRAPATALSAAAGHIVPTASAATFVDGAACRLPGAEAIAIMCAGASRALPVSEDEAAQAMLRMLATTPTWPNRRAPWPWPVITGRKLGRRQESGRGANGP
jgi:threonine dehydratase